MGEAGGVEMIRPGLEIGLATGLESGKGLAIKGAGNKDEDVEIRPGLEIGEGLATGLLESGKGLANKGAGNKDAARCLRSLSVLGDKGECVIC